MLTAVSTAISVLALVVSGVTAWLTLLRRGTVRMTQPTVIFFGPDALGFGSASAPPKIFLRTLLYATSKRGRVVQSMHATLTRNETRQNFNIWVYGGEKLVRGSGLFVGETGVAANHHFMTPKDGSTFRFLAGVYKLQIVARLVGDSTPITLLTQSLEVTDELAAALSDARTGLYFDWGPDSDKYLPHIDKRGPAPPPEELMKMLGLPRSGDETEAG